MPWTDVKEYNYSQKALKAWLRWRFADYGDAVIKVKPKDGDYTVEIPEALTSKDKRDLKKALKDQMDWSPPAQTWKDLNPSSS